MKHAVYAQPYLGTYNELFIAGMKDTILQYTPGGWFGALVSILSPLVGHSVAQAAQVIVDLGETEEIRCWGD